MKKKKIKNWEWEEVSFKKLIENVVFTGEAWKEYNEKFTFSNIPLNDKVYHDIDNALILLNIDHSSCLMVIPQIAASYGDCDCGCTDYYYPGKPLCFIGTNINAR